VMHPLAACPGRAPVSAADFTADDRRTPAVFSEGA